MPANSRMALTVASAIALAGCSAFAPEPPEGHFTISAEPAPALHAGELLVHVSYGGCGEAAFVLVQTVSRGAAVLRLRKTSPDEPCDMLLTHWLEFPLTAAVQAAADVRLVGAGGSIRLR